MHWADVEAEKIVEEPLVAAGVAPSGPIHVGFLRELLISEAIAKRAGGGLVLIVDSMDPLRKLYPFLDESYEEYIGLPLSEIPCPCGDHTSYSDHYLSDFLESMDRLGVDLILRYAHEMYAEGEYENATRKILDHRKSVASIIELQTGRELDEDWFPYNPICSGCGGMSSVKVIKFEDPYVHYECGCGYEGKADIRTDDGKLPWRCDWPARWWILGIDCEPFGKDHAASGGSWDTGKEIIKEVFDRDPPHPVVYEWIQLKGKGPMSSSSGTAISTEEMINMVGPEVVRFLIMKTKPSSHIDFDPSLGILDLVDEYDSYEERYFEDELSEDDRRVYELSQPDEIPERSPQRVPYRHLVNLVQIYPTPDKIWQVVKESEHLDDPNDDDLDKMRARAEQVEFWLENYAPDFVKFSLEEDMPDVNVSEKERSFLESYQQSLKDMDDWDPNILHQLVHKKAEELDMSKGKAFRIFYKILLGQNKGPRLGRFLTQLDREFVMDRLSEAVS